MKPARPVSMWGIVVVARRAEWILVPSLRNSRKAAGNAARDYLYSPEYGFKFDQELKAGTLRLARVTVALEQPQ